MRGELGAVELTLRALTGVSVRSWTARMVGGTEDGLARCWGWDVVITSRAEGGRTARW